MLQIHNPDNLPLQFIESEITDIESTTNHKLKEITFKKLTEDTCVETYKMQTIPFDRIRRITGYLSNLNNFNSAKQSETTERVKHGTNDT